MTGTATYGAGGTTDRQALSRRPTRHESARGCNFRFLWATHRDERFGNLVGIVYPLYPTVIISMALTMHLLQKPSSTPVGCFTRLSQEYDLELGISDI